MLQGTVVQLMLLHNIDILHMEEQILFVLRRYFGAQRQSKGQKKRRGRRPALYDYSYDNTDYYDLEQVQEKAIPVQNVYFFQKGILDQTGIGTVQRKYKWLLGTTIIMYSK